MDDFKKLLDNVCRLIYISKSYDSYNDKIGSILNFY